MGVNSRDQRRLTTMRARQIPPRIAGMLTGDSGVAAAVAQGVGTVLEEVMAGLGVAMVVMMSGVGVGAVVLELWYVMSALTVVWLLDVTATRSAQSRYESFWSLMIYEPGATSRYSGVVPRCMEFTYTFAPVGLDLKYRVPFAAVTMEFTVKVRPQTGSDPVITTQT
jgi:hypothetical protein